MGLPIRPALHTSARAAFGQLGDDMHKSFADAGCAFFAGLQALQEAVLKLAPGFQPRASFARPSREARIFCQVPFLKWVTREIVDLKIAVLIEHVLFFAVYQTPCKVARIRR